jgi:hypothetical protein
MLDIFTELARDVEPGVAHAPYHVQAWNDRQGDFYPVAPCGHNSAAYIIVQNNPKLSTSDFERGYVDGYDLLESHGWLHLWYDGQFWIRGKGNRQLSEDQFWTLQTIAQQEGRCEYTRRLEEYIRDYGGSRWLDEIPGRWYAPEY